jgi:hypothetical protein
LLPMDQYGNLWGPGYTGAITCATDSECRIDPESVVDSGDGAYRFSVLTQPNVASVRINAFDTLFDLAIDCESCPRLERLTVEPKEVQEHSTIKATLELVEVAPETATGGARVYLQTTDPLLAGVPESVVIPAGERSITFPVDIYHVHDKPVQVGISASYGGEVRTGTWTVLPAPDESQPRSETATDDTLHSHEHTYLEQSSK